MVTINRSKCKTRKVIADMVDTFLYGPFLQPAYSSLYLPSVAPPRALLLTVKENLYYLGQQSC